MSRAALERAIFGYAPPDPTRQQVDDYVAFKMATMPRQNADMRSIATPNSTIDAKSAARAITAPFIARRDAVNDALALSRRAMMGEALPDVSAPEFRQVVQRTIDNLDIPMGGQLAPKYAAKLAQSERAQNPLVQFALSSNDDIQRAVGAGRTEFAQNPVKKFFEGNAEYKKSTDPDLLCQRSAGCDLAVGKVKKELGDAYNSNMAYDIADRALQQGLEAPCPTCYVYNGRAKSGTAMQKKLIEGEAGYRGEMAKMPQKTIDQFPGGALRNYSSTDAKPTHIPGQIMKKLDSAERGVPEGAYTKEKWYADVFGPTGEYINMSVGRDNRIGMDMADAVAARRQHPNVGTTYVAMTDDEIRAAKANPDVDHVIPFHASGKPIDQVRAEYSDPNIMDFTGMQNEMITHPKQAKLVKPDASLKIKDTEHNGNLVRYLDLAEERNLIPKFPQYIFDDPKHVANVNTLVDEIKQSNVMDNSRLMQYIGAHNKDIDPNYMKLIGLEYGKHGTTHYVPSDMSKMNVEKAGEVLKEYLSNPDSVIKNRDAYMGIADDIIKVNI